MTCSRSQNIIHPGFCVPPQTNVFPKKSARPKHHQPWPTAKVFGHGHRYAASLCDTPIQKPILKKTPVEPQKVHVPLGVLGLFIGVPGLVELGNKTSYSSIEFRLFIGDPYNMDVFWTIEICHINVHRVHRFPLASQQIQIQGNRASGSMHTSKNQQFTISNGNDGNPLKTVVGVVFVVLVVVSFCCCCCSQAVNGKRL